MLLKSVSKLIAFEIQTLVTFNSILTNLRDVIHCDKKASFCLKKRSMLYGPFFFLVQTLNFFFSVREEKNHHLGNQKPCAHMISFLHRLLLYSHAKNNNLRNSRYFLIASGYIFVFNYYSV